MELRQLRYFKVIADAGSFAAGAQQLRVAQPALSRSIAKLEEEVKRSLFIRHSAGVTLTDVGRRVYEHAERVLASVRDLVDGVTAEETELSGMVKLGAPRSILAQLVMPVAADFLRAHAGCQLDLVENSGARLKEQVLEGTLDLAVLPHSIDAGMHLTPLVREKICLICRVEDRSAFGPVVAVEELLTLPLILTGYPDSLRLFLERQAPHLADRLKFRSEVNSSTSLVDLVLRGVGFGVAPCCVVAQSPTGLSFVPVENLGVAWVIATNWQRRGLRAVQQVEAMLIESVKAHLAQGSWPTAQPPL